MLDDDRQRHRRADRRAELRRERDKRYRRRVSEGKGVAMVEYSAGMLNLLIRTEWLRECDAGDARKVGEALAAMVEDATRGEG
jgi:hypothetical protein